MARLEKEFIPELQRTMHFPREFIVKKIVAQRKGGARVYNRGASGGEVDMNIGAWRTPWTPEKYDQILKFAGNDGYATLIMRRLTKDPGTSGEEIKDYLKQLKARNTE